MNSPQTQRGTYLQSFSWHHLLLSSFFFVCGGLKSSDPSVVKFKFSRAHDSSLSSFAGISLFEPFVEELFLARGLFSHTASDAPRTSTPFPHQTATPSTVRQPDMWRKRHAMQPRLDLNPAVTSNFHHLPSSCRPLFLQQAASRCSSDP